MPDFSVLRESLLVVPPKIQTRWLRERGYEIPGLTEYREPESTGLHMLGKWGRGRAWEVTGQDSLVFMSLGSEVAILNFADPEEPELLTELQLDYLALQTRVRDSLLVTGRNGIDLWSITDPRRPTHLSHIPCFVSDFDVVDTFLYFVSSDTFNAYNIARPESPTRIGFCRDSGEVVTTTRNTAILLLRDYLAFIDVSDPTTPHRVGTYGGWPLAAAARGNLCCATFSNPSAPEESWFDAIDISNPASPVRLARVADIGGVDLVLADSFAYSPGLELYEPLQVVNIADSAHPYVEGELGLAGYLWGIWADPFRGRCLVASDHIGLQCVDIADPGNPQLDTTLLAADKALDLWVDGNRLYVANDRDGLRILDISDPTEPIELGARADAGAENETAVALDSFAFIGWWPRPTFRAISISDPTHPQEVASCSVPSKPEDMVLRDTLVHVAGRLRFYTVNVARPREPVLVGSCTDADYTWDLDLEGNLAAVAHTISLSLIDVMQPSNPQVVGSWPGDVSGVDIVDTIAYATAPYTGFVALSVADPAHPYVLDSLHLTDTLWWNDVVVVDSLAYVGGERIWVVDVSNPRDLRLVSGASWTPPNLVRRLEYAAPYLYAACYEAGVCVLESAQVAVSEEVGRWRAEMRAGALRPNPTSGVVAVHAGRGCEGALVYDVLGRTLRRFKPGGAVFEMDLTGLQPGLYFIELRYGSGGTVEKLIMR